MKIYKKLFEVKSKIGKISKDSNNPFFKSKYFDVNALLENVEPLLHENNLVLLQPIKDNKVRTEITDVETGETVFSEIELPNLTDPQKLGSAVTYYRRYTLQSLLGIQAEDDDANKASQPSKPKQNIQTVPGGDLKRISDELSKVNDIAGYEALKKKEMPIIKQHPSIKSVFSAKLMTLQTTANGNA